MNPQKNQDTASKSLLDNIQGEVSAENAPLLQFITRHASFIAGGVLLLLLTLGGLAVYNWYHGGKLAEARKELARINAQLHSKERTDALAKLAEGAPDATKLFIYMSLGQSAQENGDPILAADAYARAAKLDGDGALGLTAALGSVGSLLMQAKYVEALALLQELEKKLPEAGNSVQLREMLAEAASRAGKLDLARQTYQKLADELKTPEAAYFRSRAEELKEALATPGETARQTSEMAQTPEQTATGGPQ